NSSSDSGSWSAPATRDFRNLLRFRPCRERRFAVEGRRADDALEPFRFEADAVQDGAFRRAADFGFPRAEARTACVAHDDEGHARYRVALVDEVWLLPRQVRPRATGRARLRLRAPGSLLPVLARQYE